jgi:hypothetical protein
MPRASLRCAGKRQQNDSALRRNDARLDLGRADGAAADADVDASLTQRSGYLLGKQFVRSHVDRADAARSGPTSRDGAGARPTMASLPQYAQEVLGYTPTQCGVLILMRAIPVTLMVPVMGAVAASGRVDLRWIIRSGFVIMGATLVEAQARAFGYADVAFLIAIVALVTAPFALFLGQPRCVA